jgi:hypothetical protein
MGQAVLDELADLIGSRGVAGIVDHDIPPRLRQGHGDPLADSA